MTTWIGLAAGTLTTVAFIPQVWRAWRTGSTDDLSLIMLSMFSIGLMLWVVYGFALGELPIIVSNAVSLGLSLALVSLKLRGRRTVRG